MEDNKKDKKNNFKVVDFPKDNSIPILERMLENIKTDNECRGIILVKVFPDGIEYVFSSFLETYPQHVIAGLEKIKFDLLMNTFTNEDKEYSIHKNNDDDDFPPKAS